MYKSGTALISADNRSFRYGDGFFETIKLKDSRIILPDLHFERLFTSLETLKFETPKHFTADHLQEQILALTKKNKHDKLARIRLTIFRGDGGLYDEQNNTPNYIIQTWALNPVTNNLNENGLIIDIYKDAKKSCDSFSHIKSNNYLAYAMAALWAKQNQLNDALLLNNFNRIADATIANIFIIQNGIIKTPALSEGCVSGTMRKHLLRSFTKENIPVQETQITINDLLTASEVFLTNAIYGIKWVRQSGGKTYLNISTAEFHKTFIFPL